MSGEERLPEERCRRVGMSGSLRERRSEETTQSNVLFKVLANCSLCGTEATLFFSAGPVCLSFFTEPCAILHAFCWFSVAPISLPILFSSPTILTLVLSRNPILSSIFPLISNSVADLAGTVFALLLFYQATRGRYLRPP